MKKQPYILIGLTSFLFVAFLFRSIFKVLDLEWTSLFQDIEKTEKILFLALMFSLALAFLLVLFWTMVDEISRRKIQANLKNLLAGKEIKSLGDADLDASFKNLSGKLALLTEAIQKADNQALVKEEMLSGLSQQASKLDKEKMQTQLQSVTAILETAQRDLRILLLHLRPIELEQKSLVEGIQLLLKELEEKSELKVSFKYQVDQLPKKIEEHVFRIVQELISNTLRHAQASCLDVYLYQTETELQLKVVDNGRGFQLDEVDELSYGLRNIKERVEDMAGSIQLLTAPKQGLAVDIRIPLID